MTRGVFETRRNEVEGVLKGLKLHSERNKFVDYSTLNISDIRDLSYIDTWNYYYERKLFDYCLVDGSIIQYKSDFRELRSFNYYYYENPFFQERTIEELIDNFTDEFGDESKVDDFNLADYYENQVPKEKKQSICIRYDYNPTQYHPAKHPASHIHINNTVIRLGIKKIMNPISFLFLVLRQCYVDSWQEYVTTQDTHYILQNICSGLEQIPDDYYKSKDHLELYLA